jgi:hypothetical protein
MTGSIFSEGVKVQDMKIRPLTFYLVTSHRSFDLRRIQQFNSYLPLQMRLFLIRISYPEFSPLFIFTFSQSHPLTRSRLP